MRITAKQVRGRAKDAGWVADPYMLGGWCLYPIRSNVPFTAEADNNREALCFLSGVVAAQHIAYELQEDTCPE